MKKDNQMARIEQFIGQLQTPESKDAVILLDSEMDSAGATNVLPLGTNGECNNSSPAACSSNASVCTNKEKVCDDASNLGKCFNFGTVVSKDPCTGS